MKKILICVFSLICTVYVYAGDNTSSFSSAGSTSSFANSSSDSQTANTESNAKLDNTIDVGAPGVKKIRIAVPNLAVADSNLNVSARDVNLFTQRIKSLFTFTGWFDFVAMPNFSSNKNPVLNQFRAQDWTTAKTEYVIFGKVTKAKDERKFNLEFRLYSVKLQNLIIGKVYTNLNTKLADFAIRRFGDVVLETLTGTPGPFMSQIAFVGRKFTSSRTTRIYIADFDGGNANAITDNYSINISPAWSPDGRKLTFTSFKSGVPQIYQYDLLTGKTIQMTNSSENSSGATWSSDGEMIAYSTVTGEGQTHIRTMNSYGGDKKDFINTSEIEVEPSYSPDGKYLAFTSNRYGKPMIFIRDLKTNEDTRLTFAGWYNASANWSPDSKMLAFASYDRKIDRWDLFRINVDGSNLQRLTLSQGDNEKPTWSPDGRFVMFQSTRGIGGKNLINTNHRLFVMGRDGSSQKPLTVPIDDIRQPVWGPRIDQLILSDSSN